jgi:hypothetical protein
MNASANSSQNPRWPKLAASLTATALGLFFAGSDGRAQPPDRGATKTVQGTVRRSTTAPMGEIDGAVLDDGTVIHWPPHLSDRFSAVIVRGDRVRLSGWMETGPAGDTHFELQSATNLRTNATTGDDPARPAPLYSAADGSSDFAASPAADENVERRLKALEDQIAQLRDEIRRVRSQP